MESKDPGVKAMTFTPAKKMQETKPQYNVR